MGMRIRIAFFVINITLPVVGVKLDISSIPEKYIWAGMAVLWTALITESICTYGPTLRKNFSVRWGNAGRKKQEKKERKRILQDLSFLIELESGRENWHETGNRVHQEAIVDEFREIGLLESDLPDEEGYRKIRAMIECFGLNEAVRKIKGERA